MHLLRCEHTQHRRVPLQGQKGVKKLLGSPPGQGACQAQGQQVTSIPLLHAAAVVQPSEIASLSDTDIHSATGTDTADAVLLKGEWVSVLESHLQHRFTKMYNCQVAGRDTPVECLTYTGALHPTSDEHALYFLPAMTSNEIQRIMSSYNHHKLQHGKSSACFILPRRKAEWNARVVHMQNISGQIDMNKTGVIDHAALAKQTDIASSNQRVHNSFWIVHLMQDRRQWEIHHDPPSDTDHLLTSHWHATLAGLPSQILVDTGAQQNFVSRKFLVDNFVQYQPISSPDSQVRLGNGSVVPICGQVTMHLQIKSYHTNIKLFVTELSEGVNAVLGEPWLRQTSAHIEYGPVGMAALRLWKGVRRFTLPQHCARPVRGQCTIAYRIAVQESYEACKGLVSGERYAHIGRGKTSGGRRC